MKRFLQTALLWAMCTTGAFAAEEITIDTLSSNQTGTGWSYTTGTNGGRLTITQNGGYIIKSFSTSPITTNHIKVK